MKKISIILFIIFISSVVEAQPYYNEWINFDQEYYKIPIVNEGIYRIFPDDLTSAGINIGSFDPQNLQLFRNGQEIPIYIKGESAGIIEYIEFYAFGNDGSFDLEMYRTPNEQINPYYSLINDTAFYFLTWNNSFNNQRISVLNGTDIQDQPTVDYYWNDTLINFTGRYLNGNTDCEYTTGEGYHDKQQLSVGATLTKQLRLNNISTAGPISEIEFAISGFSDNAHHLVVELNNQQVLDSLYFGRKSIQYIFEYNTSLLQETNSFTLTSIDEDPESANTDYSTLNFIKLKYPCNSDLKNRKQFLFTLEPTVESKIIAFSNLNNQGSTSYILDIINGNRYSTLYEAPTIRAKISTIGENNKFIIYAENSVIEITSIKKINITRYNNQRGYVIISHPTLWSAAQEYASYRNALLVNIEELYDQFAYGINKHPLAIRHFVDYITDTWDPKPQHLLLLGKGINAVDIRNHDPDIDDTENYKNCLIPTMGDPPSDILMVSRINNTIYDPAIPIGRISARNNDEVRYYLNKVKEFEAQEPAEWMKRSIHFGGGITESEQNTFAQYLAGYESIIEDTMSGNFVSTFLKNSSDPIQITQSDSVKKLVNGGVSLMTFFGHAYTGGFDQSIDDPSTFDNYGKYPLLLANSCYSGNIHLPGRSSTSEEWVLTQSKGTIGFFAVVFEGFSTILHRYSTYFYRNLSYRSYGQSLGQIIKQTTKDYQVTSPTNQLVKNMCLEFTLHADPAIVLNAFEKPDLTIGNSSIYFSPQNISTAIDSFAINIITTNIGRAVRDTFILHVRRTLPDGSESIIEKEMYKSLFKDTIAIKFPVDLINGPGNNSFNVYLDQTNRIDELNENNNSKQVNLFIRSSTLVPVFPYDLGVVSTPNATLKASTGDPFAEVNTYTFEIDTTQNFSSSFKQNYQVTHEGGIIEWPLPFSLEENKAYWWRVSKVPDTDEDAFWISSSFSYSPGNHGWAMINFEQMSQNHFRFIERNENTESYQFITTPKLLRCHNIGSPTASQNLEVEYDIDGNKEYAVCQAVTSLVVAVIDSLNLIPWESDRANYGHFDYPQCDTRQRPDRYFIFQNTTDGLNAFVNFVENIVPEGNHVLIYSYNRITFTDWEERVFNVFEDLGSSLIRSVPNNHPFIFYAQKGHPNSAEEIVGESNTAEIDLEVQVKSNFYYGSIESPLIGPSNNWESIEIDIDTSTYLENDSVLTQIIGINNQNQEIVLIDNIENDTLIQNLYDQINADEYPYLKLSFFTYDETLKTPVKLNKWQAFFECSGELGINQQKGFYFYSDTIQQGDSLIITTAIENVSPFDMDSLVVNYWIQDNFNETQLIHAKKLDSIKANQVVVDTMKFSTIRLNAINFIWIEVNPINSNTGNYYQKEVSHFNNIANKIFYVKKDDKNPLLDVTFDGYRIIDGEIVSSNPEILIQTMDENQFLPLDDTSYFNVYLKAYNTGIEKRINFASAHEDITFIPAELPDNKCKIIYNPVFTEDGKYALRVQSVDASNNESGDFDYHISFEIITESTITSIVNYPNPFSTSTQFVFTLTGAEIPEDLRIQIFTISGKFVKEIDLTKESQLRIGRNITDYTWDGTDMYGDRLANGVYLYRVFSKINGQSIEKRETQADSYFHKGFGKMVILR